MSREGTCIGQTSGEGVLAAMPSDYSFDLATLRRVVLPNVQTELGYQVAIDEVDLTLPRGNAIDARCFPMTITVTVKHGEVTLVRPTIDGSVTVYRPDRTTGTTIADVTAASASEVTLAVEDWLKIDNATHGFRNDGPADTVLHVMTVRPDESPCGPCFTYPP
jgi:hypothetical protein